jgi:hypothetical protein
VLFRYQHDHQVALSNVEAEEDGQAVAENAIMVDPDYPLNFYNLACADAEEGRSDQGYFYLEAEEEQGVLGVCGRIAEEVSASSTRSPT